MLATKTTEKIKTTETTKIEYREPGTGAIEFARQYVDGLSIEQASPLIVSLLKGELHDNTDKRIKRCDWCGHYYRDKTRPNNSKTCCRHCKFAKDNLASAVKKADAALLRPKNPKTFEQELYTFHAYWLEYPFYASEYYMLKRAHDWESPFSTDKLEQINGVRQRGYKRKSRDRTTEGTDKVHIRGLSYKHTYGDVETTYMDKTEIGTYFMEKYGERRLKQERMRALEFSRSKKL